MRYYRARPRALQGFVRRGKTPAGGTPRELPPVSKEKQKALVP